MKQLPLFIVADGLAALTMLGMIATGIVLRFVLPPGSGRARVLGGWDRHQWGDLHFWLALAVLAVIIVHIALHWPWVVSQARRLFTPRHSAGLTPRARLIAGIVTLTLLGSGGVAFGRWAQGRVETVAARDGNHDEAHGRAGTSLPDQTHDGGARHSAAIRGDMTLGDIAATTGLSPQAVKSRLHLPALTSDQQRLGPLAWQHGFTMQEARARLADADPQ